MIQHLEFEKPVAELEAKIEELKQLTVGDAADLAKEVEKLTSKTSKLLKGIYTKLTPAQIVQVARHPSRPHCLDYVRALIEEFTPLAGDRLYGEDRAMIAGLGRFRGVPCLVLGQEKGHDTETRLLHNFGMAKPDGYRKAQRLMQLAARFKLPVFTFVDTAGAFPGVDAEARGQAEAIAKSIETCLRLDVPIISAVIGEGGSGGAIAIATADRVLMLEHSIYSVISPEGCASILWRASSHAALAAEALKLTAPDLQRMGVIDTIVPEPLGGAQRDPAGAIKALGDAMFAAYEELKNLSPEALKAERAAKFLKMGRAA